jgi:hypothetical protein
LLETLRQLNVPCSVTTGAEAGDEMIVPSSPPQGDAEPQGSQAGAQAGAPQAGAICGPQAGAAPPIIRPPEHGERNSMNDGRRQELNPPKQLLHPGAATRLPRTIARHRDRVMIPFSTAGAAGNGRDDVMRRP